MMKKCVVYFLWATLGLFGAHHFYMRRYRHGFVWLCTLGGVFIGWARDFFVMNRYMKEGAGDEGYNSMLYRVSEKHPKPSSSWFRLTGETFMGVVFAFVYRAAIPEESLESEDTTTFDLLMLILTYGTPFALAVGVHLVGNIGNQAMSFKPCVLTAYLTTLVLPVDDYTWYNASIVSVVGNKWAKHWSFPEAFCSALDAIPKTSTTVTEESDNVEGTPQPVRRSRKRKPKPPGAGRHAAENGMETSDEPRKEVVRIPRRSVSKKAAFLIVNASFTLYVLLLFSSIWFNAYVTMDDGERVRVREAVRHFFDSPAWKNMMDTLKKLYDFYKFHGFHRLYKEFVSALDPEGESNAYEVLDLKQGASDTDIRTRCRLLSRKLHPDKHRDPDKKAEAQKQFIAVQQACDILDKVRKRRNRNARSDL